MAYPPMGPSWWDPAPPHHGWGLLVGPRRSVGPVAAAWSAWVDHRAIQKVLRTESRPMVRSSWEWMNPFWGHRRRFVGPAAVVGSAWVISRAVCLVVMRRVSQPMG